MIFAHAPAGFLTAWLTKRFWQKDYFSNKQLVVLYGLTILGGIFPDIDLFYYYLVNASASHREFFTHSILFYLLLFGIFYFWAWYRSSAYGKAAISLFILGCLGHLFFDFLGVVALFAPITQETFGWSKVGWFSSSILGQNFFAVNYIAEIIIICQAIVVFFWLYLKRKWLKYLLLVIFNLLMIIGVIGILIVNQHVFKGANLTYYGDVDKDGIANKSDLDMDEDGWANWTDDDANGNQVFYKDEIKSWVNESRDVWYDQTEGGLLEIPLRMGFVTNTDYIRRVFEQTGIYFRAEMTQIENMPVGKDKSYFDRDINNWKTWLESQGRLLSTDRDNYMVGRIVFYGKEKDKLEHVALIIEETEEWIMITDATPDKNIRIVSEAVVMEEFGAAQYIGQVYK